MDPINLHHIAQSVQEPVRQFSTQPFSRFLFDFLDDYPFIGALFVLQVIDIITGFAAAFIGGKASSSASWRGMIRKGLAWAVIVAFAWAGKIVPAIPTAKIMALYFILTELLSLLENVALCGMKLPPGLTNGLRVIRDLRVNVDKQAYIKAVNDGKAGQPVVIKEIYISDDRTTPPVPVLPVVPVPLPVVVVNTTENPANVLDPHLDTVPEKEEADDEQTDGIPERSEEGTEPAARPEATRDN